MSEKKTELKIRPYARLLTMLGDQLIKNEIVALTELIKNSYDADADFCHVMFNGFSESYENGANANILVADNGYGMSYSVITNHFLNPATPIKSKKNELRKSKKGRICQGEKGIGRFSMLKLGKKVTITTKEEEKETVHRVIFDFVKYDNEFLTLLNESQDVYLDEISVIYQELSLSDLSKDSVILQHNKGTEIFIENLKGTWDEQKIISLKSDLVKFSPLEINEKKVTKNNDFEIQLFKNDIEDNYYEATIEGLKRIIEEKALYKIDGRYDEKAKTISFTYMEANEKRNKVSINLENSHNTNDAFSEKLYGLREYRKIYKNYFSEENHTECGSFKFEFYIFDFSADKHDNFGLTKDEKDMVREHRVFLYRDDVRVQPYGAPNDDWLQIDRNRANTRANQMFSNDQLIGQIKITKKENDSLKDKTSREGIIEDSKAFEQLINIVRMFLSLIRTGLFQNYVYKRANKEEVENMKKTAATANEITNLRQLIGSNQAALNSLDNIESAIKKQKDVYEKRLDTAEALAGVGLSVEVASHDIMLTMDRLKDRLGEISADFDAPLFLDQRKDIIRENIKSAEEMFALIYMKMRDLQQIFVSSKQRPKLIKVEDIVKKIYNIYSKQYKKHNIEVEFLHVGKSPVMAKVIDAVLYQVFINMFDNSLYWLQYKDGERKVCIVFDGTNQTVKFSDNGPGISKDDSLYVFDAFYSGKGEDGRGLGLYIAKRLLNKYQYEIEVVTERNFMQLPGANFIVDFVTKDNEV